MCAPALSSLSVLHSASECMCKHTVSNSCYDIFFFKTNVFAFPTTTIVVKCATWYIRKYTNFKQSSGFCPECFCANKYSNRKPNRNLIILIWFYFIIITLHSYFTYIQFETYTICNVVWIHLFWDRTSQIWETVICI